MPSIRFAPVAQSGRVLVRAAALAVISCALACAPAGAQPAGYLYTAAGTQIGEFSVGADTSLSYIGSTTGGVTSIEYPGTLAMAKSADGENLYQLAGTNISGEQIYQYSVNSATGGLTPKSPSTVGSIPVISSSEQHMVAVFNPAAKDEAGQNALYVLSGPDTKHTYLYMFDIDPTTGALTEAAQVPVEGIDYGAFLAYSGDELAITGSTEAGFGFQNATIDKSTGAPVFADLPDVPCPGLSCDDGQIAMVDPDEMLVDTIVENPGGKVKGEYVLGFNAFGVGSWNPLGSSTVEHGSSIGITPFGTEYLSVDHQTEFDAISMNETFTGETAVQSVGADGLSHGNTPLAGESSKFFSPIGLFTLGSGIYIANWNEVGYVEGGAYRLSASETPIATPLNGKDLTIAMTGFLLSGSEEGGGSKEGLEETETKEAGSSSTGEKGSGSTGTPGSGGGSSGGGSGGGPTGCLIGCASKLPPVAAAAAPNTKIVSVKVAGAKTTIKFSGSGGQGKLSFKCKLGSANKSVSCHSPLVYKHLKAGKHHFSVDAVDSRPVADPSPAKTTFTTK
jgi:uncharacterized membrane protein YgcG